jgi:hypothetical protein
MVQVQCVVHNIFSTCRSHPPWAHHTWTRWAKCTWWENAPAMVQVTSQDYLKLSCWSRRKQSDKHFPNTWALTSSRSCGQNARPHSAKAAKESGRQTKSCRHATLFFSTLIVHTCNPNFYCILLNHDIIIIKLWIIMREKELCIYMYM